MQVEYFVESFHFVVNEGEVKTYQLWDSRVEC